jgi:hypothetical protein
MTRMIMDKDDYVRKIYDHMDSSGCYKRSNKNPLSKIMKDLMDAIKKSSLDDETKDS